MASGKNTYSVGELSKASGISVRTLHHYDEIGLMVAKRNQVNDYRIYTQEDAVLLRQIIMYRNMGMSLEKIKSVVSAADFDLYEALESQHARLLSQLEETQKIIQQVEVTMSILDGEKNLHTIFEGLPTEKAEQWIDTIKGEEYGEEVLQAFGKIPAEQALKEKVVSEEWTKRYMEFTHLPVADSRVQDLIKDAYVIMNRMFYHILDDFKGADYALVKKTVEQGRVDPVTVDIYETYQQGLAKHYFDALEYFAEHTLRDNEKDYKDLQ